MEIREFLKGGVEYILHGQTLILKSKQQRIGNIRATHVIHETLCTCDIEEQKFQDELGVFIADAVNEKLNGGWVKCSDRMPNNSDEVLVAVRHSQIPIQAYYSNERWYASQELRDAVEAHGVDFKLPYNTDWFVVTHWTPLPKLPK